MTSIVIPALNEGPVIERCLSSILDRARPGELEIVVVCHGCEDDTAARARHFEGQGVRVIETRVASKTRALNVGDDYVGGFPRFYVDPGVQLSADSIREVAALLADGSPFVVAAPRPVVAYEDRPSLVRAFYRVWTHLPDCRSGLVGGVYAFSRHGRARFGRFPDIIADHEFARLIAAPGECLVSPSATFTIHPPRTLRDLLHLYTQARAGLYELRERFPDTQASDDSDARSLREIATSPRLWPAAPVYLGVMLLATLRARRRLRQHHDWAGDDTSRQLA